LFSPQACPGSLRRYIQPADLLGGFYSAVICCGGIPSAVEVKYPPLAESFINIVDPPAVESFGKPSVLEPSVAFRNNQLSLKKGLISNGSI